MTAAPDGGRALDDPGGSGVASSSWQPAAGEAIAPSRPPRPVAIDFASTVLIVTGAFRLLGVALALGAPPEAGIEVLPASAFIETVIQLAAVVLGLLIRQGRAWLVAVNFAATIAFIQLISFVGPVSVAFSLFFALAFVAIFVNRPWFLATRAWQRAVEAERRR